MATTFRRPISFGQFSRTTCLCLAACLVLSAAAGCVRVERRGERLVNTLPGVRTVVVAPMMNLSTTPHVDMVAATNAFASELAQVEGLTVVPVGRVYQYLVQQERATVGSPEEARALAAVFGADATIVAAITEYDPYNPPRVGMAAQLYRSSSAGADGAAFDPVVAGRSAAEFSLDDADRRRPLDQVSRIFSARNRDVETLARLYARDRLSDESPHGWRRFIVAQDEFVRLVSYGIIREMLGPEGRQPLSPVVKLER